MTATDNSKMSSTPKRTRITYKKRQEIVLASKKPGPLGQLPSPQQLPTQQKLPTQQQLPTEQQLPAPWLLPSPVQQQSPESTLPMVRILTSSGWKPAECKPDNIKHDYETDEDEFDLNQCFVEPPIIVITPRKRRAEDNYSGTSRNCRPRLFK